MRTVLLLAPMFVALAQGPPDVRVQTLQKAAALIERHDLASAETSLQPLLANAPADAVALNLLGLIRMEQKRPEEAETLFRQALATGHHIAGPHVNLAVLYQSSKPLDALAELAAALKIAPENAQAQSLLRVIAKEAALSASRSGNASAALTLLANARESLPRDPEILYEFGSVALGLGLNRQAQQALEEALQNRPDYPEAHYALARVYLEENRPAEAERHMRAYLVARPDDATAHYGLGYILVAAERLDEAKAAFERSLALQPGQTESVLQLGEIALEQGKDQEARKHFRKVLSIDPHHAGALTGIGVLAYRDGDYPEAKTNLEEAVANAPKYQKAHYYFALTLAKLGDKTNAGREFEISKSLQKRHGAP
jgi:tetratricopeptide (TPR) repeat protein